MIKISIANKDICHYLCSSI